MATECLIDNSVLPLFCPSSTLAISSTTAPKRSFWRLPGNKKIIAHQPPPVLVDPSLSNKPISAHDTEIYRLTVMLTVSSDKRAGIDQTPLILEVCGDSLGEIPTRIPSTGMPNRTPKMVSYRWVIQENLPPGFGSPVRIQLAVYPAAAEVQSPLIETTFYFDPTGHRSTHHGLDTGFGSMVASIRVLNPNHEEMVTPNAVIAATRSTASEDGLTSSSSEPSPNSSMKTRLQSFFRPSWFPSSRAQPNTVADPQVGFP